MRSILPWSLVGLLSLMLLMALQQRSAPPPANTQPAPPATRPGGQGAGAQDMGARMVEAIKATEGCMGVKTAQVSGGQNAIFAFFENKQAAMNWYNHPMHVALRGMFPAEAGVKDHVPMAHLPDGVPVLAVASIGFNGPPAFEGSQIPFSSISIELYVPVNGGLRIVDGMAPEKFAELTAAMLPAESPRPK